MKKQAVVADRRSKTGWVVLAMLLQGPATGYAIKRRIEASVGNFWQESFGQLYPALTALASQGLVEGTARDDARGSCEWSITPAGRQALTAWVATPVEPQPERNELLLKVFLAELHPAAVREHIDTAAAHARRNRLRLQQLRVSLSESLADHPGLPGWLATLDYGLDGEQALIDWAARTRRTLTNDPAGEGP